MLLFVDCAGHYGNNLAASVFFNMHIVSKLPAEFPPPICTFIELCNLRCTAKRPRIMNLPETMFYSEKSRCWCHGCSTTSFISFRVVNHFLLVICSVVARVGPIDDVIVHRQCLTNIMMLSQHCDSFPPNTIRRTPIKCSERKLSVQRNPKRE